MMAVTDVYRRPVIAGSLAVDEARIGGETVSRVRLNAKGGVDASDITLTATARGLNLDARAKSFQPIRSASRLRNSTPRAAAAGSASPGPRPSS